jgi:hypothetical protein
MKYDHLKYFKRDSGFPLTQAWASLIILIHKVYKSKQDSDVTEMEKNESRLMNAYERKLEKDRHYERPY